MNRPFIPIDILVLAIMAFSTFAFIGFLLWKFLSYRPPNSNRNILKDFFNDKSRLN